MSGETSVLLVGSRSWRQTIRARCPKTTFDEEDVPPAELAGSITLVIVEHVRLIQSALVEQTRRSARSVRWFACAVDTPADLPVGVRNCPLGALSDDWFAMMGEGLSDPDLPPGAIAFAQRIEIALPTKLIDVATNLLISWKSKNEGDEAPGSFGHRAFNRHLEILKSSINQSVPKFVTPIPPGQSPRSQLRLKTCFYVSEKTVILARARRFNSQPSYQSRIDHVDFGGNDLVDGDDGFLTALLLIIMNGAPENVPLDAEFDLSDQSIRILFPFPLAVPVGPDIAPVPDLLDRLRVQLPEVLSRCGAIFTLSDSAITLTLRRSMV